MEPTPSVEPSGNARRYVVLCVAVFIAALVARSPRLFIDPRFWAEEGVAYYGVLQGEHPWRVLTLVVQGNFQLLTNLFSYLATLVPAVWAPWVTTYLALAVGCVLAALVGVFARQNGWSAPRAAVAVVAIALLPHGYEVYLSSTNVQWVCSLTVLLLSVLRLSGSPVLYGWVALCGLTGVPSLLLAPAFLVRRFVAPSAVHFRIGLVLSVCALVQLAVILTHQHPARALSLNGSMSGLSFILQTMLAPLLTMDGAEALAVPIRATGAVQQSLLVLGAGVLLAALTARATLRRPAAMFAPAVLIALWVGVTCLEVFGSLGDAGQFVSGWFGSRYFMLGAVCFVLLLGLAQRNVIPGVLLLAVLGAGVYQVTVDTPWKMVLMTGPSWKQGVQHCEDVRPCVVHIWPPHPGWEVQLKER